MLRGTVRERVFARSTLGPLKVPCFTLISALQEIEDPSLQLDALALTFTIIAQGAGIDPHSLVTRAKCQLLHAEATRNTHLEAIRDYAVGELT